MTNHLTDHERDNLKVAIHGSMTRLMSNYKTLHKEVERLADTFGACAEELVKRAVEDQLAVEQEYSYLVGAKVDKYRGVRDDWMNEKKRADIATAMLDIVRVCMDDLEDAFESGEDPHGNWEGPGVIIQRIQDELRLQACPQESEYEGSFIQAMGVSEKDAIDCRCRWSGADWESMKRNRSTAACSIHGEAS